MRRIAITATLAIALSVPAVGLVTGSINAAGLHLTHQATSTHSRHAAKVAARTHASKRVAEHGAKRASKHPAQLAKAATGAGTTTTPSGSGATVVNTTCQSGYSAATCAVIPSAGTFTIPTPCAYTLAGTGDATHGGMTVYVRQVAAPMPIAGTNCVIDLSVDNGLYSTLPVLSAVGASGTLNGKWYRFEYTTNAWTQVQAPDATGIYAFVPS